MQRRKRIGTQARRLELLLMLLFALAPTSGAAAEKTLLPGIGADDRRRPVLSTAWPWAAIGRLNTSTGRHCTATLIARDRVVTAGHCVRDPRTGKPLQPSALHFLAGYQRGAFAAHAVGRAVLAGAPAPSLAPAKAEAIARDWAIVTLDRPLAIRPVSVRPLSPEPAGEAEAIAPGTLLRAGYSQDRPHLLTVHEGCSLKERLAEGRVWLTDCDATRGDSGSPVLIPHGLAVDLVGIAAAVVEGVGAGTLVIPAAAFAASSSLPAREQ